MGVADGGGAMTVTRRPVIRVATGIAFVSTSTDFTGTVATAVGVVDGRATATSVVNDFAIAAGATASAPTKSRSERRRNHTYSQESG